MAKQQGGFTLIELVLVIVILGILAATALPRFVDLSTEARRAALQGVKGSLDSAAAIGHATYLARSLNSSTGTYTCEGGSVTLTNGYPGNGTVTSCLVLDANAFSTSNAGSTLTVTKIGAPGTCTVTYTDSPSSGAYPTITLNSGGC